MSPAASSRTRGHDAAAEPEEGRRPRGRGRPPGVQRGPAAGARGGLAELRRGRDPTARPGGGASRPLPLHVTEAGAQRDTRLNRLWASPRLPGVRGSPGTFGSDFGQGRQTCYVAAGPLEADAVTATRPAARGTGPHAGCVCARQSRAWGAARRRTRLCASTSRGQIRARPPGTLHMAAVAETQGFMKRSLRRPGSATQNAGSGTPRGPPPAARRGEPRPRAGSSRPDARVRGRSFPGASRSPRGVCARRPAARGRGRRVLRRGKRLLSGLLWEKRPPPPRAPALAALAHGGRSSRLGV